MFLLFIKKIIAKTIGYKKPTKFGKTGENVEIGLNCEYSFPENIELGSNVKIGDYTGLFAQGGIRIDDGTILADHVDIRSSDHYYDGEELNLLPFDEKVITSAVHIQENCWIGAHVIILSGVTIGEGSVIGAGSVIAKDVAPLSVVVGNPGRIIKCRDRDKYYELKNNGKQYMKEYHTLHRLMISRD